MASWLNRAWSAADFWDKKENEQQKQQFAAQTRAQAQPRPVVQTRSAPKVQQRTLSQPPKQSFFNKVRDQFDANTEADQWRRQQEADQKRQAELPYENAMRRLQQRAQSGQIDKNVAAAQIRAMSANSAVQPNTAKNVLKVDNRLQNTALAATMGVGRSLAGTGESLAGLYDIATPGQGNNRFGKVARRFGEQTDEFQQTHGLNKAVYRGAQVATDISQFMAPGKALAGVASRVGGITSKIPAVARATGYVDDLAANGSRLQRAGAQGVKYLARPDVATDVLIDTAQGAGLRANRGQDVSLGSTALDAGMSVGFGGAVGLAGKAGKTLLPPTTRLVNSTVQASKNIIPATTKLVKNIDEVAFTPRSMGRMDVGDRAALEAFIDLERGAIDVTPQERSLIIRDARSAAENMGINLYDGSGVAADNVEAFFNARKAARQSGSVSQDSPLLPINRAISKAQAKADPLEALKAEARKYKSAEEFVEAKTNQYHGTLDNGFKLDQNKHLFLTGDTDSASTYAGRRYNQEPTGKVVGYHAKDGKTLDLNDSATREKYVREVLGQDKQLKKYYDRIPESARRDYFDTLGWVMEEYKAGRIPKADLDKYTQAQKNYKAISAKDVYANWDNIIARAKKDGYDYIKHTTEDPSAEITFPETVAINPNKSLLDTKQLTDLYNQATAPVQKTTTPVSKIKDKELRDLATVRKQLIDEEARMILESQRPQRNIIKEVLDNGGISSSAYETLPKGVKRKSGMSADKMAQVLGFEDEDAFVSALNDYAANPNRKLTKAQAKEQALELLESGKSQYNQDWQMVKQQTDDRTAELDRLGASKITKNKPTMPSEEEFAAMVRQAEIEGGVAAKTKSAVAKAVEPQRQAQREAVLSGDLKTADKYRKKIAEIQDGTLGNPPKLEAKAEDVIGQVELKDISGKSNKATKQKFMDKANTYLGEKRAAQFSTVDKARKWDEQFGNLTDQQKLEVIVAADNPSYKTTDLEVQRAVKALHDQFDTDYRYFTKDRGINMGYQHSYYPRMYRHPKTGDLLTSAEYQLLQTGSSRQKSRVSDMVNPEHLVTKDPAEAIMRYNQSLENAASGKKFLGELEKDGLVISSSEPVRGMRPVIAEGMQQDGMLYYAKPEVAKSLDRLFGTQEASGAFEKLVEKGQGLNSFVQSLVLSGGIPNTPVNAFGFMQVMKSTMAGHPIQAGKAFLTSLGRKQSDNFFKANSDTLQLMAKNGLDIRVNYQTKYRNMFGRIKDAKQSGKAMPIAEAWDQLTNDATFQRFMPMLETMHFKNVYQGLVRKGVPTEQAAKQAADTTANFFGKTKLANQAARSKVGQDALGAVAFAPRFRESMINFWGKNLKSLKPGNWSKAEYRDNQKFIVAAAAVWGAMEGANMAINGNWMHDNPDGKKDKLLIPGLTSDGKDVGIPFLPSIATVPRNAAMGVFNTLTGNFEEAGKNIQSFASMPLKTATEVFTNENYFGQPIVDGDAQGIQKVGQMGAHVVKSNIQPWIREGLNIAGQGLPDGVKKTLGIKKKSGLETVSNALEAPLRFYDPAYYKGGQGKLAAKSKFKNDGTTPITGKTEKNMGGKYTSRDKYDAIIDAFSKRDGQIKVNDYDTDELRKASQEIGKEINDQLKSMGLPEIKSDVISAKVWANFKKQEQEGKFTDISKDNRLRSTVKNIYRTRLSKKANEFFGISSDDAMRAAIQNGRVDKKTLEEAIQLDNMLTETGLQSYAQIGKTLRAELGYGTPTSKVARSGGRKGRGGTKSRLAFDPFKYGKKSSHLNKELRALVESAALNSKSFPKAKKTPNYA